MKQGLSEWIRVPLIVARGINNGYESIIQMNRPTLGLTAAVHGNELNGVFCIHRLMAEIDCENLNGTIVAIPCVNVPGYLAYTREFIDKRDLNREFPGNEMGMPSQIYAYHLMTKIVSHLNVLIDLHTASFGRMNSFYVRANLHDEAVSHVNNSLAFFKMAKLMCPQIILHNNGQDGTLREAASTRGVKVITVEIGNPQTIQKTYTSWCYSGLLNILHYFGMRSHPGKDLNHQPIICSHGYWMYTRTGGVLEVYPKVSVFVDKGELIATIRDIFGNIVDEYYAPCKSIIIGKSSNPVAMSGDRIAHIGFIHDKNQPFPLFAKEEY
ncbi:Succinylglutamate desuccinylase/aspartoacylase [Rozella allomycis CSF55]|uniref:Succinylglutamate desuccinylase/aspartoacylase n=1 Tax=Rozella allomycis (strain CSF55) TaxID=988480 RepID=A0A075AQ33_ROZAC|nr:Succinylglutamate desuccinylase/aspartoacylase domain-containing protein [Rozella allomycis CSF55]RKP18842.1 Succinylglutamate desuccinylase/aspartoacylase [Rozella allomycis CSF55]|eukprot:EPZ32313.1 Succinylglutamate desuccinylase/aspartoacylase domain-containing protein [Rozella allomycis CSF55]